MLPTHRLFRVFVSSTFNDLRAERNALQKHAFKRLRELCARHGAEFHAIDLRWGISEGASFEQATMPICLSEIARCQRVSPRPNFLRFSVNVWWRPPPAEMPSNLFADLLAQLAVSDRDSEHRLLTRFYRLDTNAIPAIYSLVPRRGRSRVICGGSRSSARSLRSCRRQLLVLSRHQATPALRRIRDRTGDVCRRTARAGRPRTCPRIRPDHRRAATRPSGRKFFDVDAHARPDVEAGVRLEHLKNTLRQRLGHHVHPYRRAGPTDRSRLLRLSSVATSTTALPA